MARTRPLPSNRLTHTPAGVPVKTYLWLIALTGTPAFIVDDKLIPGYTELANLQAMLATTRANGGCKVC